MITRLMAFVFMVLKIWCARITRSRITIAFFLFVLANCAAQTTLHTQVFLRFARDRDLVTSAIVEAGVQRGFIVFQNGVLEKCFGIPTVHGTTCYTVYNSSANATPTLPSIQAMQCAEGLTWLENYLRDSRSEEVVYLVFQCWLVVIALLALANESIPNLIVGLAAQVVNTGWISYRIISDISAKWFYNEIIVDGTCGGFDILKGSWRQFIFYLALGFSIAALLGAFFFVSKLVKLYAKGTLSSVGSSPVIDRLLKWRLWMRVFLKFTAFFALASAAMWYDKRKTDMIALYSTNILYDAGFYVMAIILLLWLALGTYSISKENRFLFFVYALLSIYLLVISALWFSSAVFRYEYGAWCSFASVTTMADVLLIITCALSVTCRLNFGRGLVQFPVAVVVERALQASGFAHDIFQHGSSDPGIDVKQVFTSNRPEPPSYPTVNISRASLETSKYPTSTGSVESLVLATWLSSQDGGDREKSQLHVVEADRLGNIIIISRENVRPSGVQSVSDDGSNSGNETDEKQNIVT